jgi:hypothetical protein
MFPYNYAQLGHKLCIDQRSGACIVAACQSRLQLFTRKNDGLQSHPVLEPISLQKNVFWQFAFLSASPLCPNKVYTYIIPCALIHAIVVVSHLLLFLSAAAFPFRLIGMG